MPEERVLVLGIGNTLLGDEGLGVATVLHMQSQPVDRRGVRCVDGGTLSFTLAGEIEDAQALIVIDAAELRSAPGTVQVFEGADMDDFVSTRRKSSVHEVNLVDLLAIARLTGHLPRHRALIGIQPQAMEWACGLTPAARAAVPAAAAQAWGLVGRWRCERGEAVDVVSGAPGRGF